MIDVIKNTPPFTIFVFVIGIIGAVTFIYLKIKRFVNYRKKQIKHQQRLDAAKVSARRVLKTVPRELLEKEPLQQLLRIENVLIKTVMDDGSGSCCRISGEQDCILNMLKHMNEIMIIDDHELSEVEFIRLTTKSAYNKMQKQEAEKQRLEDEKQKQQDIKLKERQKATKKEEDRKKFLFFERLDSD